MESLISKLKVQTESLKIQYIEQTSVWANNHFDHIIKRLDWKEVDWCTFMGITPRMANPGTSIQFLSFPVNFYNTRSARELDRLQNEVRYLDRIGKESYVKKEVQQATQHYEDSIIKLADRILKKGLNPNDITMVTSHIDVNIETIITERW